MMLLMLVAKGKTTVPQARAKRSRRNKAAKASADLPATLPAPAIETPGIGEPPRGHSLPDEIATLPSADRRDALRIIEARLFASTNPLAESELAVSIGYDADINALLEELKTFYAGRGINLVRIAGKWTFRTAEDLAFVLEKYTVEERRLSKAALETLAIIAYHQPATRAEIEDIRGVSTSKGTLDVLMETGWIRQRGRRRAPGKPLTYGTTELFMSHFGLNQLDELPGLSELKGAGLLDATLPPDFRVPEPKELAALMPDELPLEEDLDDDDDDEENQVELEFQEDLGFVDEKIGGAFANGRTVDGEENAGEQRPSRTKSVRMRNKKVDADPSIKLATLSQKSNKDEAE